MMLRLCQLSRKIVVFQLKSLQLLVRVRNDWVMSEIFCVVWDKRKFWCSCVMFRFLVNSNLLNDLRFTERFCFTAVNSCSCKLLKFIFYANVNFTYHLKQSKEECEYLIELAKPYMVKSSVVDSKTGKSTESRFDLLCCVFNGSNNCGFHFCTLFWESSCNELI